jgi:hypothetical protein
LTCREVEDLFGSAIMEGSKHGDDPIDVASASTAEFMRRPEGFGIQPMKSKLAKVDKNGVEKHLLVEDVKEDEELTAANSKDGGLSTSILDMEAAPEGQPAACPPAVISCSIIPSPEPDPVPATQEEAKPKALPINEKIQEETTHGEKAQEEKSKPTDANNDPLAHKYIWGTVAVGALLLGAGCLVMALSLGGGDSRHNRRRYTRR